ncbi:MAG: hypothetical protein GY816_19025, partial [Cytophagales bacterium]|nr:hypothetical protein [Cytophagales bacterium]
MNSRRSNIWRNDHLLMTVKLIGSWILMVAGHISMAQALQGIYTIGTSGDYTTFNAAVSDMESQGVNGDVTFNVQVGTYSEQIEINGDNIDGIASSNISFIGMGNREDVIMTFSSNTVNEDCTLYLVNLLGGGLLNFEKMTFNNESAGDFANVVKGFNIANTSFTNCVFSGQNRSDLVDNTLMEIIDSNTLDLEDNLFENGLYGLSMNSVQNSVIHNNTFTDQNKQGLSLNVIGVSMTDNLIQNSSDNTGYSHGTEFWNSEDYEIVGNRYILKNGTTAIFINSASVRDSTEININNNYIEISSVTAATFATLWLTANNIDFFHNTIRIISGDACISFTSGSDNRIFNNFFANETSWIYSGNALASNGIDYNNLFASGSVSSFGITFEEHQAASGFDMNSTNYEIAFATSGSPEVCHFALSNSGLALDNPVFDDIYGSSRDISNPDIGAYEFTIPTSPIFEFGQITLCEGSTTVLESQTDFVSYLWEDGSTDKTIVTDVDSTYVLIVTDAAGCVLIDSVDVDIQSISVDLGSDITICVGNTSILDAGNGYSDYLWSTGEDTQTIEIMSEGEFSVTVTDDIG